MQWSRRRICFAAALALVAIAVPVYAALLTVWDHPCTTDDLQCGLHGMPPCYCDADFNDPDNWLTQPPGDADIVKILHSHAEVTDEDYLVMDFADTAFYKLRLITDDTGGDDDLDVRFDDKNAGGDTITVGGTITLDATNGKVTLQVLGDGRVGNY